MYHYNDKRSRDRRILLNTSVINRSEISEQPRNGG